MANTLRQLERELGAIFGGRHIPRPTRPAQPETPRYVVHVGTDGMLASPAPGFEHLQARELGRYVTPEAAERAQRAYNEAHPDDEAYAWLPTPL